MNENIKKLWSDAALVECHESNTWDCQVAFMSLFAELIVRECIQVSGPEDSYTDEWFKAKSDSVNKIKEHFGVEV